MDFLLELNWLAVGQIILIDILLGGDNAIVIALACRNLPDNLRLRGILWGTFGAIAIRIVLIAFAVTLLQMPFIKLVGGILLFWIGTKLLSDNDEHGDISGSDKLLAAIKTIIVADLVMSLDNVIAIASAAEQAGEHQLLLVIFGILVSIPIIVWGSTLVLKLMEKVPLIITLGAALLGYLAGGMIISDVAIKDWVQTYLPHHEFTVPGLQLHLSLPGVIGAVGVVIVGSWLARRAHKQVA
ncbi:integral membrane protein, YjbE family [Herbaspirillum sp. CF444]|uniref:TerC family protein n=1 Tax=Herbaspirillum sp. CF444 TaxID=1144319 RepID=UPI000272339D|nr:TerC family protein [Herbaspirillum sp. CF444]EJL90762.1 integral membrane protein, YjbE family [Herbaspirillum sp. CF444]